MFRSKGPMQPIPAGLRPTLFLIALALLGAPGLRAADLSLTVVYEGKATVFSEADLSALAHQDVTAFDFHEKKSHVYTGVPVRDVLAKVGIEFGEKLRGRNLRLAVLAHCRDHYDIVFALAEFEDAFNSRIARTDIPFPMPRDPFGWSCRATSGPPAGREWSRRSRWSPWETAWRDDGPPPSVRLRGSGAARDPGSTARGGPGGGGGSCRACTSHTPCGNLSVPRQRPFLPSG